MLPDENFYEAFYREFNKRYSRWDDLPESWRAGKQMVADLILGQTRDGDRLLSIGCGNGYIEFVLSRHARHVTAIEPSRQAIRMLRTAAAAVRICEGYFPEALSDEERGFALGYMVATEYVFDDRALLQLLSHIRERGILPFLLVSSSVQRGSLIRSARAGVRALLGCLKIRPLGQLWGYERAPGELIRLFRRAGYARIVTGHLGAYFWVQGDHA